jgi:hypothetical protein
MMIEIVQSNIFYICVLITFLSSYSPLTK